MKKINIDNLKTTTQLKREMLKLATNYQVRRFQKIWTKLKKQEHWHTGVEEAVRFSDKVFSKMEIED